MKIKVTYENRYHPVELEVPGEDCEVWVEADFQRRLEAAEDKEAVRRRTPQEIMDEELGKPTFNGYQREHRRHVSLDTYDADGNRLCGESDIHPDFHREEFADLYRAIERLRPRQRDLLFQVYWEDLRQVEIARSMGVTEQTISKRMARIYKKLKEFLESK